MSDLTLTDKSDRELRARRDELDDRLWVREGFDMSKVERRLAEGELKNIDLELATRARDRARARHAPAEPVEDCPFCDYAGPNTVLWENTAAYVVEPLRQVTPGHVLVIPKLHATDFAADSSITATLFHAASQFAQAEEIEDCNLITSKGPSASQTVKHVHVHVLPRTWDDSVRLPWNNPYVSPSPTHHLYQRVMREHAALLESLHALRKADGGRFEWETDEAIGLVGHAGRYLSKPGEWLYCNWRDCLHADPDIECAPDWPRDYAGRAIPLGEGKPFFKGRMHDDCAVKQRGAG